MWKTAGSKNVPDHPDKAALFHSRSFQNSFPVWIWCQVDSKMNLASKNLGAIYGSMGRMVRQNFVSFNLFNYVKDYVILLSVMLHLCCI